MNKNPLGISVDSLPPTMRNRIFAESTSPSLDGIWDNPTLEEREIYEEFLEVYLASDDELKKLFQEDDSGVTLRTLGYDCERECPADPVKTKHYPGCSGAVYRVTELSGPLSPSDVVGDYEWWRNKDYHSGSSGTMINEYRKVGSPTYYVMMLSDGGLGGVEINAGGDNRASNDPKFSSQAWSDWWGWASMPNPPTNPPSTQLNGINTWTGSIYGSMYYGGGGGEVGSSAVLVPAVEDDARGWITNVTSRIDDFPTCAFPIDDIGFTIPRFGWSVPVV